MKTLKIVKNARFLYDFLRATFGVKPKIFNPIETVFFDRLNMRFFVRSSRGDLLRTKFRMLDSALKDSFREIPINIGDARIAIYDEFDNYVGSLSWNHHINILSSGEVFLHCIPVCNGSELGTHRLSKKERKELAKKLEKKPGSFTWDE